MRWIPFFAVVEGRKEKSEIFQSIMCGVPVFVIIIIWMGSWMDSIDFFLSLGAIFVVYCKIIISVLLF